MQRPALVPSAALGKALQDVGKSARRKVVRDRDGTQPRAAPLADDCGLPSSARSAANLNLSGNILVCHTCENRTLRQIYSGCSMLDCNIGQVS